MKRRTGYRVLRNGGTFEVDDRAGALVDLACCQCSLVHRVAFARERSGRLGVAVRVNRGETHRLRQLRAGFIIRMHGRHRLRA